MGLRPYEDIDIEFSGLRPGEKMYEELILNYDNTLKTDNEKIFIEKPESFSGEYITKMLSDLEASCKISDTAVRKTLKTYIPTFQFKENN